MKPCYKDLKEIGVDVNEIWRKMLDFGASIGLLTLILIISWNETVLWRFERNRSWCWWDMKENVRFWSKCRVVTPYFDRPMKWNPVIKIWKKSELMSMRYEGKMLDFGASIGLLPLILIISWNETVLWRFERNRSWCWWDMKENVRFWSKYRVVTPYFDRPMKWNPVIKIWKKSELMSMRYEGKC